ncbi:MAG: M14 family zinc carboxypeptidase [bacterium]
MYRTVAQLDSLSQLLASWFPQYFTRVQLPEASVQGRPVYALRLRAGVGEGRRAVLLVGGTHSRELMNPDAIIELAVDLFVSYRQGTDVVYGGRTWSARDVKVILETLDLWLVPCSNPDGREYVMTVDNMWRKNRRTNAGTECRGVDLNRNLDIVWGVTQGQTSCAPCSDVYCGPSVVSEPETRNIRYLLNAHPIDCFADVHSYSELVLYPWGHAPTQTANPAQQFTGLPTGTCTTIGQPGYQEYMPPRDLMRFQTVGQRIVDAITAVRGRVYTNEPAVTLYPVTGSHSDYAYSRHIANPRLRKTYGYTLETGPWAGNVQDSFHPADPTLIKRDAKSGLLALVQQCICAIELVGSRFLGRDSEVSALRRVRDNLLATTEAGRGWIALFERVQTPLIGAVLEDERLASEAVALVESAGLLADNQDLMLSDEDVARSVALVQALSHRAEPHLREDLEQVRDAVEQLRGRSMAHAVETLMHQAPRVGRRGQLNGS